MRRTYELGFGLGLEEVRHGEQVRVADAHLLKWSANYSSAGRQMGADRLFVKLLLLAAPDNRELLETLFLSLVGFFCLELQLLLLLLVDVSTPALGGRRRALRERAKQRAKQTLSALALLDCATPAAVGAAIWVRAILVLLAVLGVIVGVVYAQARALATSFGDGGLPALLRVVAGRGWRGALWHDDRRGDDSEAAGSASGGRRDGAGFTHGSSSAIAASESEAGRGAGGPSARCCGGCGAVQQRLAAQTGASAIAKLLRCAVRPDVIRAPSRSNLI